MLQTDKQTNQSYQKHNLLETLLPQDRVRIIIMSCVQKMRKHLVIVWKALAQGSGRLLTIRGAVLLSHSYGKNENVCEVQQTLI